MVEVDPSSFIVPIIGIIISIAIPIGLFSMRSFNKTSEGTLTGTVRIENLKVNLEQVQETMDKGFGKLENMINRRDDEMKKENARAWDTINLISSKLSLFEYRLKQLERNTRPGINGSSGSGGHSSKTADGGNDD